MIQMFLQQCLSHIKFLFTFNTSVFKYIFQKMEIEHESIDNANRILDFFLNWSIVYCLMAVAVVIFFYVWTSQLSIKEA